MKKPIFVLAPMADVTDSAFRRIIAKYSRYGGVDMFDKHGKFIPHLRASGGPDVFWTEFVSADGLMRADKKGKEKLLQNLIYTEAERPIIAQFFTSDLKAVRYAAKLAVTLGFDGIDINMGCPDRSVEKQGAGAALMKDYELAQKLIISAKDAIKEEGSDIPLSVKTRAGYKKNEIDEWIPVLLEAKPAVITLHARTRKQMSNVPADWSMVKRAVKIRDKRGDETLILGNGDVLDINHARKLAKQTGADGVMIGRAIFGRPDLFSNSQGYENRVNDVEQTLKILVEHAKLFDELYKDKKNFAIMKKHFKAYVCGWEGASKLRLQLMTASNSKDVAKIVDEYVQNIL